ncbi:MAG: hypothetical protein JKP98_05765 [Rhodobacteraceae bacterium]|nr:hypothetical protein [Paracoccaceae bacterium]
MTTAPCGCAREPQSRPLPLGGQNRKGATLRTRFDSQIEYGRSGDWADPINLKLIALDLQPG